MTNAGLPTFESVKASEAPKPISASANSDAMDAYEAWVKSLKASGEVGRVKLTNHQKDGKTLSSFRSIASSVRRAAKRVDIELDNVYERDGYAFVVLKNVPATNGTAPQAPRQPAPATA